MLDLKNIIESLLFVAEEPIPTEKLRTIIETADSKEIRSALQALSDEYDQRGGGFRLQEVAGGWQIRSRPEYHEWIKRMLQPSPHRLSKAALETLAIIAYKQPIIRADIEHIRGVDCGGVLRQLLERKLVRVLGRREIAGRPLIYATTKLFLEMFDLKDLNDLPTPKEIAEFSSGLNAAQAAELSNDAEDSTESPPPAESRETSISETPTVLSPDDRDSYGPPIDSGNEAPPTGYGIETQEAQVDGRISMVPEEISSDDKTNDNSASIGMAAVTASDGTPKESPSASEAEQDGQRTSRADSDASDENDDEPKNT